MRGVAGHSLGQAYCTRRLVAVNAGFGHNAPPRPLNTEAQRQPTHHTECCLAQRRLRTPLRPARQRERSAAKLTAVQWVVRVSRA